MKQKRLSSQKKDQKNWTKSIKWVVASVSTVFLLIIILSPIKRTKADFYLEKGDKLLSEGKYISAIVEYKKSDYLLGRGEIDQRIELSSQAQKDIMELGGFLREYNDIERLNQLKIATSVPQYEYDAVLQAKEFLEQDQPQLAILSAKTATEMDYDYRDAWLYLGISHLRVTQTVELNSENQSYHLKKAKSALTRAKDLDPNYEEINKYLELIKEK